VNRHSESVANQGTKKCILQAQVIKDRRDVKMDKLRTHENFMPSRRMCLFYDEIYSSGLDRTARFPVDRYSRIAERIKEKDDEGLIELRKPRLATREEILLVHDYDYVDRFLSQTLEENEIRRIGLRPWKPEILERTLRLVGGALDGLDLLKSGEPIAGNMAGGTHHAFAGEGAGYCIFNDLAVCAKVALGCGMAKRVLVLDLDVHQGDGTAEIFKGDDRVFTVSLHGQDNFPFRKKTSDFDLGFSKGTEDEEFLIGLDRTLGQLDDLSFDLLFFQAGVDGLEADALGLLNLTREGMNRRNELVFNWRRERGVPLLLFMGGGYANPIDPTVDAFADLFFGAAQEYQQAIRP
jgi:acetoin utilization deacetylase AcuC-like enzyme